MQRMGMIMIDPAIKLTDRVDHRDMSSELHHPTPEFQGIVTFKLGTVVTPFIMGHVFVPVFQPAVQRRG